MLPGAFWGKYDKIGRWDGDIYSTFDSVVYVAGFKHVFLFKSCLEWWSQLISLNGWKPPLSMCLSRLSILEGVANTVCSNVFIVFPDFPVQSNCWIKFCLKSAKAKWSSWTFRPFQGVHRCCSLRVIEPPQMRNHFPMHVSRYATGLPGPVISWVLTSLQVNPHDQADLQGWAS